jgi:hypothetical protein
MGLDAEQQNYFNEMEEMFATTGWKKHHMDGVLQQYERNLKVLTTENLSNDQVREIRGGLKVLKSLLDYEQVISTEKEYILNPPEEEYIEGYDDAATAL